MLMFAISSRLSTSSTVVSGSVSSITDVRLLLVFEMVLFLLEVVVFFFLVSFN